MKYAQLFRSPRLQLLLYIIGVGVIIHYILSWIPWEYLTNPTIGSLVFFSAWFLGIIIGLAVHRAWLFDIAITDRASGIALIVLVGFFAAFLYHYNCGIYNGMRYPYNTFLFRGEDHFKDLFNIIRGCCDLDPYNPVRICFIGGYFPFAYFFGYLLSLFPNAMLVMLTSAGIFLLVLLVGNIRFLTMKPFTLPQCFPAVVLALMTYPVLLAIDRGNFDMFMLMFFLCFLWCYYQQHVPLAMFFLAATIAMKLYTAIYLVLLLRDRKYKEAAGVLVIVVLLTVCSLAVFHGGLLANYHKWLVSMDSAMQIGVVQGSIICFSSSLFTFLSIIGMAFGEHWNSIPEFSTDYLLITAGIFLLAVAHLCKYNVPRWRSLSILTVAMFLLPYTTGDYRLIFLFVPLWLYCREASPSKYDLGYILLFGLLLIPKNYLALINDLNVGMIINPLLLLILGYLLMIDRSPAIDSPLSPTVADDDNAEETRRAYTTDLCSPGRAIDV